MKIAVKDKVLAKRYAEAFLEFTRDKLGLSRTLEDLMNLKNVVLRGNPEFLEFLNSFDISYREKCAFIDKVLADDFSEETRNFLKLLAQKGRADKLNAILEYVRVTYVHQGEAEALLKTSFPLDLSLIKKIEERLEYKLKKKFKFFIDLDASLLGGIQVVIGNTIIDGSVRRRLDDLREKLNTVRV